ncbi:MAG TPA: sigma-70 family RNA polymerase sigma factor [Planctomycetota bacterium]|nr:sigma-70 family RNA polymerase sigma factor [Planctomycetota bacterium]
MDFATESESEDRASRTAAAAEKPAVVNEAVLAELVSAHRARVYALAKAILKRHELAEDATQETFLRVVRHYGQNHEAKRNASAWILCIARNVAIGMWRRHKRRDEVEFDTAAQFDLPPAELGVASPVDNAIDREDVRRLVAAIDRLPGPLREVLTLKFYHNLEPREIAKVVGVTDENARIRIWRAVREVRSILGEV